MRGRTAIRLEAESFARQTQHCSMYFIYLLENNADKSWYTGYTTRLKQRIIEHQSGNGCRTTSMKDDWKLIYFECYTNKQDALGRERFLKGGSGRIYLKKQLRHYLETRAIPSKQC